MGSGIRAIIAIAAIVALWWVLKILTKKLVPVFKRGFRLGFCLVVIGLVLMIPTRMAISFGSPWAIALAVICMLVLAMIVFMVLGPLGIAGGGAAISFGLAKMLSLFASISFLSSILASLHLGPRSVVSPYLWGGLIFGGLCLIAASWLKARTAQANTTYLPISLK